MVWCDLHFWERHSTAFVIQQLDRLHFALYPAHPTLAIHLYGQQSIAGRRATSGPRKPGEPALINTSLQNSWLRQAKLQELDLGFCGLGGSIPITVAQLTGLKVLKLNNNHFKYAIPQAVAKLAGLQILWLQNNRFTALHNSIQELTNLVSFKAARNKITGA